MRELNLKGLKFSLIPKDVKKFERLNPIISVNILQWTENQALPLQVTEYRDRPHHVTLLLLHDNKTSKSHYTLVRDLSRLVLDALRLVLKLTYVLMSLLFYLSKSAEESYSRVLYSPCLENNVSGTKG